jgi:hypothetical protein
MKLPDLSGNGRRGDRPSIAAAAHVGTTKDTLVTTHV